MIDDIFTGQDYYDHIIEQTSSEQPSSGGDSMKKNGSVVEESIENLQHGMRERSAMNHEVLECPHRIPPGTASEDPEEAEECHEAP